MRLEMAANQEQMRRELDALRSDNAHLRQHLRESGRLNDAKYYQRQRRLAPPSQDAATEGA